MAAWTWQLVPTVIEAGSVLIQSYSSGDKQSHGAARNLGLEFVQSVMTQRPTHPS